MNNSGLVGIGTYANERDFLDVIRIPVRFLDKDATPEEKAMCSDLIKVVRKLNNTKDTQMSKEPKLFFTGIEQELSRDKQTTITLKIFDECPVELEEIFKEGKPVKIVSEQWYNEQISKR